MTGALVTGDHVIVRATGERGFVTGYYLPQMDVRILLESGRFAVLPYEELCDDTPPAADGRGR